VAPESVREPVSATIIDYYSQGRRFGATFGNPSSLPAARFPVLKRSRHVTRTLRGERGRIRTQSETNIRSSSVKLAADSLVRSGLNQWAVIRLTDIHKVVPKSKKQLFPVTGRGGL
jgi:hypothetical protein